MLRCLRTLIICLQLFIPGMVHIYSMAEFYCGLTFCTKSEWEGEKEREEEKYKIMSDTMKERGVDTWSRMDG